MGFNGYHKVESPEVLVMERDCLDILLMLLQKICIHLLQQDYFLKKKSVHYKIKVKEAL